MSTYIEIHRRVTVCETALRGPTLRVFEDIQLPGFREYCFPLILRARAIHLVMSRLDIEGACVPMWVDMAASHSGAFTDMLRDCLLGRYAPQQQREGEITITVAIASLEKGDNVLFDSDNMRQVAIEWLRRLRFSMREHDCDDSVGKSGSSAPSGRSSLCDSGVLLSVQSDHTA